MATYSDNLHEKMYFTWAFGHLLGQNVFLATYCDNYFYPMEKSNFDP